MIKVEGLSHAYEKDNGDLVNTLKKIELEVKEGTFLAIIGHNGSGKSTLAKHLNGLILPQEGTVTVDGILVEDDDHLYDVRQKVGMVFQNPDNQFVGGTIEEDIAFGLENMGMSPDEMVERIQSAADRVGMGNFLKRPPHRLSGGQKQRSAIGSVLAMQPSYMVLDEPTSMLDPKGRKEVMKVLKELNEKEGVAIILITHFMEEVVAADEVFVMDAGEIVLKGTPEEVFAQEEMLTSIGLELPLATQLKNILKEKGLPLGEHILTNRELVDDLCQLK